MINAKRFWALFLALAMTLAMFPATVFANGDEGMEGSGSFVATFDANGGYFDEEGNPETKEIETDSEGGFWYPDNVLRDGYYFRGWSTNQQHGADIIEEAGDWEVSSENTTYYAQWAKVYTITYHGNGGQVYDEYDEEYKDAVEVTCSEFENTINDPWWKPIREGAHVFTGWTDADGNDVILDRYEVNEDIDLYAKWEDAWKITFDANGGYFEEEGEDSTTKYSEYSEYVIKGDSLDGDWKSPVRDSEGNKHYAFGGWTRSTAADAEVVALWDETAEKNETFYAKWDSGYKITYDANEKIFEDGKTQFSNIVNVGATASDYWKESDDGKYVVSGWSLTPNGEAIDVTSFAPEEDTVLYAIWTELLTLTLNPGEGLFSGCDVGETRHEPIMKGSQLKEYAMKTVDIEGRKVSVWSYGSDNPEHSTKIFSGWYLDQACTQAVTDATTIEQNMTLYAGYTSDFNNITIDFNGGESDMYEGLDSYSIKTTSGMAVDLNSFGIRKDDHEIVKWYTDSDYTTAAEVIRYDEENDYKLLFIPSEDVHLYPKWRQEMGYVYVYLQGPDVRFFTDDNNYPIMVEVDKEKDESPIEIRYSLELLNATDNSSVKTLANEDNQFFTISESERVVTLNGPNIKSAASAESLEEYMVKLTVEAFDKETGEVLSKASESRRLEEPYTNYGFIRDYSEGEEEAYEEDSDDDLLVGKTYIISTSGYGYYYSGNNPDGEEVPYDIESVEEVDGNLFKIEENREYDEDYYESYKLTATGAGTSKLKFTLTNNKGKEWTEIITLNVVSEKYTVKLEPAIGTDLKFLRTQPFALKATGLRRTAAGNYADADFSYEWSIDPDWEYENLNLATITPNENDSSHAVFEYNGVDGFIGDVPVKVVLKKNGEIKATSVLTLDPREQYYKFKEPTNFNKKLTVGKSIKIIPEVWQYSCENPSGENVTNNIKYLLYYEGVKITGADNKTIPSTGDIPYSAEEQEYDGDFYKGAFTITRSNGDSAWVNLHIFDANGNWIDLYSFEFDSLRDIREYLWVDDITAKTYTGKQIKPALEIDNWDGLKEGRDYTVSYGANINAGTGTVTITGIGDCWGTIKKTFKINPKKITPTVTLSKTAFTYNGKAQKPKVTAKNGKTKLATSQYTVTWSKGLKNVGTYTVTVKMKGNFSGSKSATYKILPKGTSIKTVKGAKKSFTATWGKQTAKMASARITGYQIQYSLKKNFKSGNKLVTVKGYKAGSKKIAKLGAKKTYYVRIRTYTKVGKKTLYSTWSKAKAVKTK